MTQKQRLSDGKKSLKAKADLVANAMAAEAAAVLKGKGLSRGTPPGISAGKLSGAPDSASGDLKKKKLQPECIRIDMFGDLVKFSKKSPDIQSPFRKYDALALSLAEEPRDERLLLYHFFCGVALTAHARRTKDVAKRRQIFETKNKLFLGMANNFNVRKLLNFRLCISRRFKVLKYCPDCTAKNAEAKLEPRDWKFCPQCTTDRNYYNVLSMFHKYTLGGASLFLGNDMVHHIKGLKVLKRVKFGQLKEELTFKRYTFSPKNLVSIDLNTLLVVANKILELDAKQNPNAGHAPHAPQPHGAQQSFVPSSAPPARSGFTPSRQPGYTPQASPGSAPRRPNTPNTPFVPSAFVKKPVQ